MSAVASQRACHRGNRPHPANTEINVGRSRALHRRSPVRNNVRGTNGNVTAGASIPTTPSSTKHNNIGRSGARHRRSLAGRTVGTSGSIATDGAMSTILPPADNFARSGTGRRRGTRSTSQHTRKPSPPTVSTNDNITIGTAAERSRTCGTTKAQSKPEDNKMPHLRRSNSDEEEVTSDSDSDDEDEGVVMPLLVPRDSDSKDDSNKEVPACTSKPAYDHKKSNPTTKSGFTLRSTGLKVVGYDEKKQQRVCERTNNERFSSSFGVSAKTLEVLFVDMKKKDPALSERDLLMGLETLKLYLTEHVMAGRWG